MSVFWQFQGFLFAKIDSAKIDVEMSANMSFNVLSIEVDHRFVCTKGVQNSIHSLNLKIFFRSFKHN